MNKENNTINIILILIIIFIVILIQYTQNYLYNKSSNNKNETIIINNKIQEIDKFVIDMVDSIIQADPVTFSNFIKNFNTVDIKFDVPISIKEDRYITTNIRVTPIYKKGEIKLLDEIKAQVYIDELDYVGDTTSWKSNENYYYYTVNTEQFFINANQYKNLDYEGNIVKFILKLSESDKINFDESIYLYNEYTVIKNSKLDNNNKKYIILPEGASIKGGIRSYGNEPIVLFVNKNLDISNYNMTKEDTPIVIYYFGKEDLKIDIDNNVDNVNLNIFAPNADIVIQSNHDVIVNGIVFGKDLVIESKADIVTNAYGNLGNLILYTNGYNHIQYERIK